MKNSSDDEMRREIGFLGSILGDVIRELSGEESYEIVEELRRAAWDRRVGREGADERIKQLVAGLDDGQTRVVIRAFTIFLDLLNMVEDRRRVQVLAQRARDVYPKPRRESIRDAITRLKEEGTSAEAIQELIDQLQIELVFTAHPTEAKRRSVRSKLRVIRTLTHQYHSDPLPEVRELTEQRIRAEVAKLWQTDFIRPWRPTVMQEVGRGLSIKPVLWDAIPRVTGDLVNALEESYGESVQLRRPFLTFGSWIGGDRDGHPGVTAEVTEETFRWLRREAIAFHRRTCEKLTDALSISQRQVDMGEDLAAAIERATQRWDCLEDQLATYPPGELCRRWLSIIRWRLEQTDLLERNSLQELVEAAESDAATVVVEGAAYTSADELAEDVALLSTSIARIPGSRYTSHGVKSWQTQIDTFGLHLARLDVRQNAKVYREVIDEIFRVTGLHESPDTLSEEERCQLLVKSLGTPVTISEDDVSPAVQEAWRLFKLLHQIAAEYSMSAIGTHVISMTSAPSDVLTVLWLWEQTSGDSAHSGAETQSGTETLPIVPLLETIDDLKHGPAILSGMLEIPVYREHLRRLGDQQMIMLGYSDSTKDGGYLAACWSLHQAQQKLVNVAEEHKIRLSFFHGRGGSLGRGGGPAARSILSLPEGTFEGNLRLTEQGEVLADRYDDRDIAYRHLEQVVWSSALATANSARTDSQRWYARMDKISEASFTTYRKLLEQPGFVDFFRHVTPISEIERLPIGSRPSRRRPDGGLADLRAIPWVFSWTQARCLIPAWYGVGSALQPDVDESEDLEELREMYQQWPFFRALVDNAELALAKSDLDIAVEYSRLVEQSESARTIASMIADEFRASCRVVLALTQQEQLLDATPWLKESIRVRNRFVDPLNLVQVELLRRGQAEQPDEEQEEELRHLTRLSINGVAAGMRTSG